MRPDVTGRQTKKMNEEGQLCFSNLKGALVATGNLTRTISGILTLLLARHHRHRAVPVLGVAHLDTVLTPFIWPFRHQLARALDDMTTRICPAPVAGYIFHSAEIDGLRPASDL